MNSTHEFPSNQTNSDVLVNADATNDAIAREALDEARHMGEAQRYRSNPGPVVPPQVSALVP